MKKIVSLSIFSGYMHVLRIKVPSFWAMDPDVETLESSESPIIVVEDGIVDCVNGNKNGLL